MAAETGHPRPLERALCSKPYYVYMTAAGNKFLRRYYGKAMTYFSTLEGLPPVDMDSTGLRHTE